VNPFRTRYARTAGAALVAVATLVIVTRADVLPEDRTDVMFHRYDGGGIEVEGPSVLIRKKIGDSFSASYQYYVDLITSASIDVLSQASAYKERRTQNNLGLDYLHGNTLYSIGWINSDEPDYKSNTAFAGISQSMFGDLTTVSFGFSRGWDVERWCLAGADSKSAAGTELRDRREPGLSAQPLSWRALRRPLLGARL
jgi:hypothetical protein